MPVIVLMGLNYYSVLKDSLQTEFSKVTGWGPIGIKVD
jgi:hypothetical protein